MPLHPSVPEPDSQSLQALLSNLSKRVPGVIYQFQLFGDGRSCFPFASEGLWGIYELTPDQVRDDASEVFKRLHPQDYDGIVASIQLSARTLQPWRYECRVILPQQGERWRQGDAMPQQMPDGSILWHGFITDITERKQAEAVTHRLAYFDALTGLPNRRMLLEHVGHALAAAHRSGQVGAVFFIDLDNFKTINDARGHSVGDALLTQVALRLSSLMRSEDTVARLGGDEFVVLVCDLGFEGDAASRVAAAVAEKIRDSLSKPFIIDGESFSSSGSVGLSLFPQKAQTVDDLLREADIAMYRAKESGRNRISLFQASMQADVEERLALQQDLRDALAQRQFGVHVQTQFDAHGTAVGGELLLRWNHPVRGNVSPLHFIPVAEETGLILSLGDWVIHQACEALVRLQAAGNTLSLSVNVSPRQFRNPDFAERVRSILVQTGAPAHLLLFEITEGLLIYNLDDAINRMAELVSLGIRFSIDDFGTGYSSLSYLKRLPLFEIKIDRSFVQDTPNDPNDTAIVCTILAMAKQLGLRVVAEGVETSAQAEFLIASECDCLQGYLFARPMPLESWLQPLLKPAP